MWGKRYGYRPPSMVAFERAATQLVKPGSTRGRAKLDREPERITFSGYFWYGCPIVIAILLSFLVFKTWKGLSDRISLLVSSLMTPHVLYSRNVWHKWELGPCQRHLCPPGKARSMERLLQDPRIARIGLLHREDLAQGSGTLTRNQPTMAGYSTYSSSLPPRPSRVR